MSGDTEASTLPPAIIALLLRNILDRGIPLFLRSLCKASGDILVGIRSKDILLKRLFFFENFIFF